MDVDTPPRDKFRIDESLRCKQCGKLCASKSGLGMHMTRAHNGGNWGYAGKTKPVASAKSVTTPPPTVPEPKKRPRKSSRSRRKTKVEATLPPNPISRSEGKWVVRSKAKHLLNYCPCCGNDLSIIIRAMQIAEGVRNG